MNWIIRAILQFVRWAGVTNLAALAILWSASGSLAFGLAASIEGLDALPLLAIALAGVVLCWLLAGARWKGWQASLLLLMAGVALLALGMGRLLRPLASLVGAIAGLAWQAVRLERWTAQTLAGLETTGVQNAWAELAQGASTLASRTTAWVMALARGRPSYDPLVVLLVCALVVWVASTWAAWWVRRRDRPLVGLALPGALLATWVAYMEAPTGPVIVWLGATILLQGLSNYIRQMKGWKAVQFDIAEIELELSAAVVLITVYLIVTAMITPSISLQEISNRIQQHFASQQGEASPAHEAFGVKPRPHKSDTPLELAQNPGLPNQHLLGSGPELATQVVMWVSLAGYEPKPDQTLVNQAANPPPPYYWRGLTYDRYTGKGWSSFPKNTMGYAAGQSIVDQSVITNEPGYEIVRQHVQKASRSDGLLYWTGELLGASPAYQVAWRGSGDLFGAQVGSREYWADSRRPRFSAAQLRAANSDYPDWVRETYLALPETLPLRVRSLALDLTAAQPTPYDRALAIESYLRTIPYTLDLPSPPSDRDLVDYFLFDLKRGFCDYDASAMVVLARAAGLPARLVVGFASGTYVPEQARFVVTEADAHAWAEVYFPNFGWVEFEPTSGRAAIQRPEQLNPSAQAPIVELPPLSVLRPAWNYLPILAALGGMLVAMVLFLGAYLLIDRWRLKRLSSTMVSQILYQRLYRWGIRLRLPDLASRTPFELAARLEQRLREDRRPPGLLWASRSIHHLAGLYALSVYSPHPPEEGEKARAIENWFQLRVYLLRAVIKRTFSAIRIKSKGT